MDVWPKRFADLIFGWICRLQIKKVMYGSNALFVHKKKTDKKNLISYGIKELSIIYSVFWKYWMFCSLEVLTDSRHFAPAACWSSSSTSSTPPSVPRLNRFVQQLCCSISMAHQHKVSKRPSEAGWLWKCECLRRSGHQRIVLTRIEVGVNRWWGTSLDNSWNIYLVHEILS